MNAVARGRARRVGASLLLLSAATAATWSCGSDSSDPPDGAVLDGGDSGDAPPVNCPSGKEPKDDPTCVSNDVGIFVSAAGNDANAGTKTSPVATLGAALTKAGSSGKGKIFVCEGSYTESVEIKATVGVYGGFKCSDWSYSGTKPKFGGAKPDYVVKIDGASGVTLADLELDGKDGAPNSGESSVALLAIKAQARLARAKLIAGKGSDGGPGILTPVSFPDPSIVLKGNDASGNFGGGPKPFNCPAGGATVGGKGGDLGSDGDAGLPSLGGGAGGAAGPSGSQSCTTGGNGANAPKSADGDGAKKLGSLVVTWVPENGNNGIPGAPGQGGGGGGSQINGGNSGGGGGGGAGGCGGASGGAGKGGGGSVALGSVDSALEVFECEVSAGAAGAGGAGAAGQQGQQAGGAKGSAPNGCAGGLGGFGGPGGSGGGGAGGVSVGILYKGTKPTTDAATDGKITVGTKGNKGLGGATPANDGIDGVAQAVLQAP